MNCQCPRDSKGHSKMPHAATRDYLCVDQQFASLGVRHRGHNLGMKRLAANHLSIQTWAGTENSWRVIIVVACGTPPNIPKWSAALEGNNSGFWDNGSFAEQDRRTGDDGQSSLIHILILAEDG